jgi:hypothetical protein
VFNSAPKTFLLLRTEEIIIQHVSSTGIPVTVSGMKTLSLEAIAVEKDDPSGKFHDLEKALLSSDANARCTAISLRACPGFHESTLEINWNSTEKVLERDLALHSHGETD